jgi:hypothetical protein
LIPRPLRLAVIVSVHGEGAGGPVQFPPSVPFSTKSGSLEVRLGTDELSKRPASTWPGASGSSM